MLCALLKLFLPPPPTVYGESYDPTAPQEEVEKVGWVLLNRKPMQVSKPQYDNSIPWEIPVIFSKFQYSSLYLLIY